MGCAHAREMAEVFGLGYVEITGSLGYVRRLACGLWGPTDLLRLEPGESISVSPFITLHSISLP